MQENVDGGGVDVGAHDVGHLVDAHAVTRPCQVSDVGKLGGVVTVHGDVVGVSEVDQVPTGCQSRSGCGEEREEFVDPQVQEADEDQIDRLRRSPPCDVADEVCDIRAVGSDGDVDGDAGEVDGLHRPARSIREVTAVTVAEQNGCSTPA